MKSGVIYALAAAALFGASTPFAKLLVGQIPPIMLAGLLYLGSGIGLLSWLLLRRRLIISRAGKSESFLTRTDVPYVAHYCWRRFAVLGTGAEVRDTVGNARHRQCVPLLGD